MKKKHHIPWILKYILSVFFYVLSVSASMAGKVEVTIVGQLEEGFYAPKMTEIKTGKVYQFKNHRETASESTWRSEEVPEGAYIVSVGDHHPSIGESCFFSKKIVVADTLKAIKADIGSVRRIIVLKHEIEDDLPKFGAAKSKLIIGRLRRLDKAGLIHRWIVFKRTDETSLTANVSNCRDGVSLLDLYADGELKVFGSEPMIGYAEWTRKISFKESQAATPIKF